MPTVEIEGHSGLVGTKVYLDGQLVPHLNDVTVCHPAGGLLSVHLRVLALDGLHLKADDVRVLVRVEVQEGKTLKAEPQPDGSTLYTAVDPRQS
jgi:hypothetical protein